MNRLLRSASCAIALALGACVVTPYGAVGVGVHVAAPRLVVIGGSGVYWAADLGDDIFFYDGRWYWCDGPYWYVTGAWGDTWVFIDAPPAVFLRIPVSHPVYRVVFRHPGHPGYQAYVRQHYPGMGPPGRSRGFERGGGAGGGQSHGKGKGKGKGW